MRIEPQTRFPVTRALDPHDADTNYVRALIYHLKTDDTETLLTPDGVDLTDQGGQRFLKYWRVKAQQANQGDYIRIEVRVYTDSGYTALNENYGIEANLHLVKREVIQKGGVSYGTGFKFDYKRVGLMLEKAVRKVKVKSKISVNPTPVSVKLKPITKVLAKIVEAIKNGNEITSQQKEELKQLTEQVKGDFETTTQAIKDIPELPDIKSLVEQITNNAGTIETSAKAVNQTTKSANKNTEQLVTETVKILKSVDKFEIFIKELAKNAKQMELVWDIIKENLEQRDEVLYTELNPFLKTFNKFSESLKNIEDVLYEPAQ